MRFTKMHGAGNDYVYVNGFEETVPDPAALAVRVSDRHFGVGSDGLILILPSYKADCCMRIFNADGSEAEMCGNGVRCVAKYVYDHGIARKEEITVETGAGVLSLRIFPEKGRVARVRVNMGMPRMDRSEIPMVGPEGRVVGEPFPVLDRTFSVTCVSMGNPHCVIFVDEVDRFPVERYGRAIENHPAFPRRTNVEFVQVVGRDELQQRTWERGSGETLACGTGASAVAVSAFLNGIAGRRVRIHLRGGELELEWSEEGPVYMTGPAVEVFTGVID
ncbi:MAG: diaminopimelate epimerase [Nitrospinae bacterium]|nr:diaminopimelate epimerase [Nitrospinota bacterium]